MGAMREKNNHDFIIIGDGIAGRGIALSLARCGFAATIIAPADTPRKLGGVQLAPNGWSALTDLGVDESVRGGSMAMSMMRILSLKTGHSLVQLGLNDRTRRTPYTSITRAHLMDTLENAIKATGKIRWLKASLKTITSTGEAAAAQLDDGTTHYAHWVIGTDSATGICRLFVEAKNDVIPPDAIPRRVAFRMIIPAKKLPHHFAASASNVWLGDGGHIVHYPLADATVNIVATVSQSPSAAARIEAMLAAQPRLTPLIPHLKDAIEQPLFNYPHLDVYQRGRVVLAGDAAHPMPPHLAQGAGQALVDAASLQRHLGGVSLDSISLDDMAEAFVPSFTHWTAERVRAIRRIRTSADRAGAMFALGGPMARLRNIGLSTIGGAVLEKQLDALWQG
jgi:salicylate hydroxylase